MPPGSDSADSKDQFSSVPDLWDEPLTATWLHRGNKQEADDFSDLGSAEEGIRRAAPPGPDIGTPLGPASVPRVPEQTPAESEVPTPKKRKRRRWPRVLASLLILIVLAVGGTTLYVKRQFDQIERVALSPLLAPPSAGGTNYLIVGTDSRENLDPNVENAGAIFGDGTVDFGGQRTDTIQILRINTDGTHHILALPRDLYVQMGGNGEWNRINAAFAFGGGELLIQTIEGSLGIPIHHYAEVDFAGFMDLVDSVGGVTIDFSYPAYDDNTGLNVPAGPVKLDSAMALAFVRSRYYIETIDGKSVIDPRGDLGRVKRQQAFLQALAVELDNPTSQALLLANLDAPLGSFRIDDSLTFVEAAVVANELRGLQLNSEWDLVVSHFTTPTGAQVLAFDRSASQPTLDFFSR